MNEQTKKKCQRSQMHNKSHSELFLLNFIQFDTRQIQNSVQNNLAAGKYYVMFARFLLAVH